MDENLSIPTKECECKDVIPQSQECYDRMTVLTVPDGLEIVRNAPGAEPKVVVPVDPCLADEVRELWEMGIVTTGCCCGHNLKKYDPYIGVREDFIPKMKELGYRVAYNSARPGDEDQFIPKCLMI